MCDERTEAENEAYLERLRLSRREAGMGAGAALAAMLTGCNPPPAVSVPPQAAPTPAAPEPTEPVAPTATPASTPTAAPNGRAVLIDTPDGRAEAFFVAPAGEPRPGVLIWPDVAGLRESFQKMAIRLAAEGYAVLAVNQYYRSSKLPVLSSFAEWKTEAGKQKIGPMRELLTPELVAKDGAAFVNWLDQQPEVDKAKKVAAAGYCMGGSFTFRTAAAVPARVGAIASFHGGGLVTEESTSPHLLFGGMQAQALICIAQNDDERQPDAKATLQQAAAAANVPAEIEVYPAQHGWCVLDSPVYDHEQAERAWQRMLATFASAL